MNHESIYIDVHETGNESEILLREKFKEQLLAQIKAHKDVLVLREFLVTFKNNGMDKESMLENLEELREESTSATEDILLELMDFVAGFCNPRLSIF